jgi:hypothetical protein
VELGRAQLQEHVEDDTTQCSFFICIFLDSRWSRSCLSSCECFRFELRGGGTLRVRCSALVGELSGEEGEVVCGARELLNGGVNVELGCSERDSRKEIGMCW